MQPSGERVLMAYTAIAMLAFRLLITRMFFIFNLEPPFCFSNLTVLFDLIVLKLRSIATDECLVKPYKISVFGVRCQCAVSLQSLTMSPL